MWVRVAPGLKEIGISRNFSCDFFRRIRVKMKIQKLNMVIISIVFMVFSHVMPQVVVLGRESSGFGVTEKKDRLEIFLEGKRIAEFVFSDPKISRPYFSNLHVPSGFKVTRNHPPIEGVDAIDHDTMHPGVWLGFGDISGVDFWRNKGRIEHLRFSEEPKAGKEQLVFSTENRLVSDAGREICEMRIKIIIKRRPSGWLLVWDAVFKSEDVDFSFGDQEEMGFGARVATNLTEKKGGVISSSSGLKTAKATWGNPASWCDYSSIKENQTGITLMASPVNFRESWWHNRDYGVFVANPFGRNAMKQGSKSLIKIKKRESFRIVFGAMLHEGPDYSAEKEYHFFSGLVK